MRHHSSALLPCVVSPVSDKIPLSLVPPRMQNLLPIAAFAERAQLSRRTIERKIVSGEIAADYVRRRGRRVFIDAAALATVASDLSRQDATRKAVKPPESQAELISVLHDTLRRERERADRAEARAEIAEEERRELQRQLGEASKGIILLQRQLTASIEPPPPMTLAVQPSRADRRHSDGAQGTRRFSCWRFWRAA
jgi:hypothetical protein